MLHSESSEASAVHAKLVQIIGQLIFLTCSLAVVAVASLIAAHIG